MSATHEMVEAITNPDSVIMEFGPITGVNVQCNGTFWPVGVIPLPPIGPPPGLFILNGASRYAWTDTTFNICNPQEIADTCTAMTFGTTGNPDGTYSVSGVRLNSTGSCQVSPVQNTVTDPPPPPPVTEHDRCLDACSEELTLCMADAHTGPERGACARQAQICRRLCPP